MLACLLLAFVMDEFERVEGPALKDAATGGMAHDSLSFAELGNLPNVLRDSRSALLVVKTDQGNLARLLVAPAYKKPPDGGKPLPVLLVEKLDTFEAGAATKRLARARDLILYDGFLLDLDSGGVVPEGMGGDLRFSGAESPMLEAVAPRKILTFADPLLPPDDGPGRPSHGRLVRPGDFAGRYRIFTNGQGSGNLDLKVGADGELTGRFASEQTGGSYKVAGRVGEGGANRVRFTVALPRVGEDFEGLLFSGGKGAIVGSYTLIERTFGFLAIREGGTLAPEGEDLGEAKLDDMAPGKVVVAVGGDAIWVDGKPIEADALAGTIAGAVAQEPRTWVLLKVEDDVPWSVVRRAIEQIQESAPEAIRFHLLPAKPPG